MMYRVKNSKYAMLGGVCAGISHRAGIALWVVRLLCLFCVVLQPLALFIYLGMWVFLPVRNMSDQEFKTESIAFRDIPSVKTEVVLQPDKLEIDEPLNWKKSSSTNVLKDIEDKISKEVSEKSK